MTTSKRFTPDYAMHAARFEAFAREAEHGEYVRFDAHQQTVSALEAERDALADRVDRLGGMLTESRAATKSAEERADALAVENAALKSSIDLIASAYTEGEPAGFEIDRARHIETPATSAALAAIQAQGVEMAAVKMQESGAQTFGDCYIALVKYANELREAK
ncbi:TPA: hypothetical protein SLP25_004479 [Serratia marcescens]|nr:hypothetical protein [Serratia marcescens]